MAYAGTNITGILLLVLACFLSSNFNNASAGNITFTVCMVFAIVCFITNLVR